MGKILGSEEGKELKRHMELLLRMLEQILREERLASEEVRRLREEGLIDERALDRYSRLRRAREWIEDEFDRRGFLMEGARLLLAEHLEIKPGDVILDLGSGDGWFSIQAGLLYPEAQFYGVELSEEFAEANEYAKIFSLENVHFFYLDAYDLPFPSESIDKIAMFFSLANIALNRLDLERLFEECSRVLKPGGLLGIAEAFLEDFPEELGSILLELYARYGDGRETLLPLSDAEEALLKRFELRRVERIKLRDSGAPVDEAAEYLQRYYRGDVSEELIEPVKSYCERVWVRDDPPSYHILVAEKTQGWPEQG